MIAGGFYILVMDRLILTGESITSDGPSRDGRVKMNQR